MGAMLQMTCGAAASTTAGAEKATKGVAKDLTGDVAFDRVDADALLDANAFHCSRSTQILPLMPHSCCRRPVRPNAAQHSPSYQEERAIS